MMENIPSDIVEDILSRLPAKTIVRLRCVSKSWKTLFAQPSFITAHLHRSLNTDDRILVLKGDYASTKEIYTDSSPEKPNRKLRSLGKPPFNPSSLPDYLRFVGSCNGLICLSTWPCNSQSLIHTWNPSLMEFRILPPFSVSSDNPWDRVTLGFGFDATSDDYKVVKLLNLSELGIWSQVEVYSLRNDAWKRICDTVPPHFKFINNLHEVVTVNGCVHWIGLCQGVLEKIIFFDMDREGFGEISFPDQLVGGKMHLGSLAGQLSTFSYRSFEYCEVWVMKDYGVVQSWTKHHAVATENGHLIDRPLGFTRNGEILFKTENGHLVLYDPKSTKVERFRISMAGHSCDVAVCVDSLVSVAPVKCKSGRRICWKATHEERRIKRQGILNYLIPWTYLAPLYDYFIC